MMNQQQQPINIQGEAGNCIRWIAESLVSGDLQRMDWAYFQLRNNLKIRLAQANQEIDKLFEGNK